MRQPISIKPVWAAVALLAVAGPATAGPIPAQGWSVSNSGGGFGTEFNAGSNESGVYTWIETLLPPNPAAHTGPATVGLFSVESGTNEFGMERPQELGNTVFDTSVWVTDGRSGQAALVHFTTAFNIIGPPQLWQVEPVFLGPISRSVNVGGTVYTVTERFDPSAAPPVGFHDPRDIFDGAIVADVKVSQTPEPATLGLAALGLAGVAAGRLRRGCAGPATDGLV